LLISYIDGGYAGEISVHFMQSPLDIVIP